MSINIDRSPGSAMPTMSVAMEVEEALETTKRLLAPRELGYVEEMVLAYTWDDRSYREMASETAYDEGYLKIVGSHLWQLISERLGCSVTKKRLRSILIGVSDSELCSSKNPAFNPPLRPEPAYLLRIGQEMDLEDETGPRPSGQVGDSLPQFEFPGSPLSFGSPLYIERPPIEKLAIATLRQPGSLIRIKAPRRMGKTSLLNQVLGIARRDGIQPVVVDIRQADTQSLDDIDAFLRWFCSTVGQQLGIQHNFDQYWFDDAGSKLSCTTYMQEHLLRQVDGPVAIAIDTVHHLLNHRKINQDFFSMLRSWYEQAKVRPKWQKLRLILAYLADLDIPLQRSQSPFNIGLPLELQTFTVAQAYDLANRYGLQQVGIQDFSILRPLFNLVDGQPYLLQLAFYWLRSGHLTLEQLLQEAPTNGGIYGEHLHRLQRILQQNQALMDGFQQVLSASGPTHLSPEIADQLESIGLTQTAGMGVSVRCDLYQQYFCTLLGGNG